jgi:autotransporter-associated beta strand protein
VVDGVMRGKFKSPLLKRPARQALLGSCTILAAASVVQAQVTFAIDPTKNQTSISPFIYGVNAALNSSPYQNLNLTFERQGGNRWTAYNYTNNASNAGSDYLYENDDYLGGGSTPAGAVLPFVQAGLSAGAGVLVTVPINGYVAADFSGPQNPSTPPQDSTHFVPEYPTQAQDPVPAANHVYENGFVQLVANAFATAGPNQPLAFDLDNEPDLWDSTHQEVHPEQTTYAELLQKSIAYATMIKSVDPSALVYGPVSYGWEGYESLQDAPDSAADGNFLNYYLKNMASASSTAGVRLLDALDLHWYPEATGINASGQATRITEDDTSPGVVAARLQAPRSLWDPTYTETSWITQDSTGGPIDLIPRTQAQITANYPGTKLSFSEYNYGAGDDISGGLAEADVLGIFGKYGVYSANEWALQSNEDFIDGAFQLYRNYDGKGSTFGNTEVQANNSDTVNTSIYASIDSTNPNKENQTNVATVNLSDTINYKTAAVYQLTSANATPQFVGDIAITNPTSFTYSMPAYSVSLISFFVPGQTVGTWAAAHGGSWTTLANWTGAPPQTAGDTANFTTPLAAPSTITLDANQSIGTLNFNSTQPYTIAQGTGSTLTLDNGTSSASITDSGGSHTISAPITLNSNLAITVSSATNTLTLGNISGTSATLTKSGAGNLALTGNTSLGGGLSIQAGTVTLSGNKVTVLKSLSFSGTTGKLDLTASDLIVQGAGAAGLTNIFNQIKSAANFSTGGYWNGTTGITSSSAAAAQNTALGVELNDNGSGGTLMTSFDGQPVTNTDVLVKYTYAGDADLSGTVNASDYTLIDNGFNAHLTGWRNGDFNYDGVINGDDYVLIDNAFNSQGSVSFSGDSAGPAEMIAADTALISTVSNTAVPEPGILILFPVLACRLLAPRRVSGARS